VVLEYLNSFTLRYFCLFLYSAKERHRDLLSEYKHFFASVIPVLFNSLKVQSVCVLYTDGKRAENFLLSLLVNTLLGRKKQIKRKKKYHGLFRFGFGTKWWEFFFIMHKSNLLVTDNTFCKDEKIRCSVLRSEINNRPLAVHKWILNFILLL